VIEITFDPEKRKRTIVERGLDFADAALVFAGPTYTGPDERFAYGEPRYITVGHLGERMIVVVWTPREGTRRIISMRKANEREQAWYARHLRPGA
jgi:uncharacterized protein